jgi:hypothetical protein
MKLAGCDDAVRQMATICFTICLFISPDLDGHRAPNGRSRTDVSRMFHECLFISPDLDGHRAPKNRACFTNVCMFHDMFHDSFTILTLFGFTICLGTGILNHRASEYSCSAKTRRKRGRR